MNNADIPANVMAAIRRARLARHMLTSRRRRVAAIVAGMCLVTAVPLSLSFGNLGAGDVLEAAVSKAQSLAEMLGKRSPGQRTEAQLTKTKRARALAKVRPAPRQAPPPAEAALAKVLMGPAEPAPAELAAAPVSLEAPPPSVYFTPPPGGGGTVIVPPGGGPPGGTPPGGPPIVTPPGGTPPTTPDHPTPSPVPEPATWAMMLLGFGLIGWRVRYARRDKLAAA